MPFDQLQAAQDMGGALGAAPVSSTPPAQVAGRASQFDSLFSSAEQKYGLPPGLLKAMAHTESNFNPGAVSPKGAKGLMQFMPATAARFGIDPSDPAQAVDGAARYVQELGKRFNGDVSKVVAAYNAGEGSVEKYGGIPPFKETQGYVERVKQLFTTYNGGVGAPSAAPSSSGPSVGYNPSTGEVYVNGMKFDVNDGDAWVASSKLVGQAGKGLPAGFNPIDQATYVSKLKEATTPNATVGGALKRLGRSVMSGVGSVFQAGAEVPAAALNAFRSPEEQVVPANVGAALADWSGLFKQDLGNQASIRSTKALREGDVTNMGDIQKGFSQATVGGLVHMAMEGFGSLAPGLAAAAISPPLGFVVFGAMAGGSNGEQTYNDLMAKKPAEWAKIPEYNQLVSSGYSHDAAANAIATKARQVVTAATAPAGMVDMLLPGAGVVSAKASAKILSNMAKKAMTASAIEAGQETGEGVVQKYASNKATGFSDPVMAGSLGNAVGGALAGGPLGAGQGGFAALGEQNRQRVEADAARAMETMRAQSLMDAANRGQVGPPNVMGYQPAPEGPVGPTQPTGPSPQDMLTQAMQADPAAQAFHQQWQQATQELAQATTPEQIAAAHQKIDDAIAGGQTRAQQLAQAMQPPAQPAAIGAPPQVGQAPVAATPGQAPSPASPPVQPAAGAPTVDSEYARLKKHMVDTASFLGDEGVLGSVPPALRRDVARKFIQDGEFLDTSIAGKILEGAREPVRKAAKGKVTLSDEDITALVKAVRQQDNGHRGPLKALHHLIEMWDNAASPAAAAKTVANISDKVGNRQALAALLHSEFAALAAEIGQDNLNRVVAEIKAQDSAEADRVLAEGRTPKNIQAHGVQKRANTRFSMAWNAYTNNTLASDAVGENTIRYTKEQEADLKGSDVPAKLEEIINQKAHAAEHGREVTRTNKATGEDETRIEGGWKNEEGEAPPTKNFFRIVGLLDYLLLHDKSILSRTLASAIRSSVTTMRPDFEIVIDKKPSSTDTETDKHAGLYEPGANGGKGRLTLYPLGQNPKFILHELLHAVTADYVLSRFGSDDPHVLRLHNTLGTMLAMATPEVVEKFLKGRSAYDRSRLPDLLNKFTAWNAVDKDGKHQQDVATAEFVAYGMTESVLQDFMKSLKLESVTDKMAQTTKLTAKKQQPGKILTVWSRFVESVSQIVFGRSWKEADNNIMSQFLSDTAQLMHAAASAKYVERTAGVEKPATPKFMYKRKPRTASEYWNQGWGDKYGKYKDLPQDDKDDLDLEFMAGGNGIGVDNVAIAIATRMDKERAEAAAKSTKTPNTATSRMRRPKKEEDKPATAPATVQLGTPQEEWDDQYRDPESNQPTYAQLPPTIRAVWDAYVESNSIPSGGFKNILTMYRNNEIAENRSATKKNVDTDIDADTEPTTKPAPKKRAKKGKPLSAMETPVEEEVELPNAWTTSSDPLLRAWGQVAGASEVFKYPDSKATDIQDIIGDILPGVKTVSLGRSLTKDASIQVSIDDDHEAIFNVFKYGGPIELNVATMENGMGGSLMYHIAATWARNNDSEFSGDRVGMTRDSKIRRIENMLSASIRHGTTRYVSPGINMPGFEWKRGNDTFNMRNLLLTSHANVIGTVPRMRDIIYDFNTGEFVDGKGKVVSEERFSRIARSRAGREALAGTGTLKRTAVTNAILRGRGPEKVGADGLGNAKSGRLKGALYATETVTPEERAKRPEYWAAREAREAKVAEAAQARAEAAAKAATSSVERTEAARLQHAAKESFFKGSTAKFRGPLGLLDMMYEKLFKATGLPTLTKGTWAALERGNAWIADTVPMYRSFLHNTVSGYGLSQPYLAARHTLQQGQVHKIKANNTFFVAFAAMPPDQQLVVTDALLNPGKTIPNITPDQQAAIDYAKANLKKLIDEGVKAGTLPADLEDMEVGAVLKAVYLKDIGEPGKTGLKRSSGIMGTRLKDIGKVVTSPFANVVTSPSGKYHQAIEYRKDGTASTHFFPAEGSPKIAEMQAAGRDIEVDTDNVWRMSKEKTNNETATFFRPFTSGEMVGEKMVSDPRYLLHATVHHLMQDIMHAEMFNFLASYGRDNSDDTGAVDGPGTLVFDSEEAAKEHQEKYKGQGVRTQNWVQVPNVKNNAGKPKFGALTDKWVSQSIWNDINAQVGNAPMFPGYDKWLTRWKLAKTAYSPVTHVNNIMSNFALAFYRDVPASNIIEAARIYWNANYGTPEEKAAAEKIIEEFDDSGANIGSYGQSEIRRGQMLSVVEELAKNGKAATQGMSEHAALMKVMEMVEHVKATKGVKHTMTFTKWAVAKGKSFYEMEDNVFRLASYMTHIQNGESIGQAGLRASQDFVDYNITAPWINKLRGSFFPFIAWPYRMIPAMIGIAIEKPWKFATMMTALYGLNALGFALAGGDEDEERRFMPEYQKGRLGGVLPVPKMVRLPWSNTYWDASPMMPLGDLGDLDATGFFGAPWLRQFMPSGPLVILAEGLLGYNAFRGEKITKETNTVAQNISAVAKHVAQSSLPNLPYPGSRQMDTLIDVLRDKHGITGAEINGTLKVLAMLGPKIYANDLKEEKAIQGIVISKLYREYSAAARALGNQEYRYGSPDAERVQREIKELNDRFLAKMKEIQSP